MKSNIINKLKFLVGAMGVVAVLSANVNAQGASAYAVPYYSNNPSLNYMMGVVNLGGQRTNVPVQIQTNIPTNVVPVVVPVQVSSSTCKTQALSSFHKYGDKGADVVKLQKLLNKFAGAKLNEKGFYGPATAQEVKNLQYMYGINPTGMQYAKTTALLNSLDCGSIQLKTRKVFTGNSVTIGNVSVSSGTKAAITNVYPNPSAETAMNFSKFEQKNKKPTKIDTKNLEEFATTSNSSSTNSFFSGLKGDFDKIKENYKAYVLVFVLVLALFWFLRKAAIE